MTPTQTLCFIVVLCVCVHAKPTIYMKNENDKLEPVLIPISSTVIPLSVYKVGYSVGVHGSKPEKGEEENKLITVSKKKVYQMEKLEGVAKSSAKNESKKRELL
uniref:Uncharacterized protein n=1 Tax=Clastoptera arizonana TaxID=38151 RepID=A0A1B6ECG0_9HEMI